MSHSLPVGFSHPVWTVADQRLPKLSKWSIRNRANSCSLQGVHGYGPILTFLCHETM